MKQLPQDFLNQISNQLTDKTEYEAFIQSIAQSDASVSIRLNPLKNTADMQGLDFENMQPVPWCDNAYYLPQRPLFTADPLLHAGAYYVQEASSMFLEQVWKKAIPLVQEAQEEKMPLAVLDLCAAPGGKSTHAAALLPEDSLLICNEIIANRSQILQENLQKWGMGNTVITQHNPQQLADKLPQFFDIILVDAPCSGEGMFRKDPAAIEEWSLDNVQKCTLRQREILEAAWTMLKPNGVLIYSTCTYNSSENEDNILWWSKQHALKSLDLGENYFQANGVTHIEKENIHGYKFMPHLTKGEGFFVSFMQKLDDNEQEIRLPNKFRNWQWQGRKQIADISKLMKDSAAWAWIIHNEEWRAFPDQWAFIYPYLYEQLRIVYAGISVAEQVKKEFKPNPVLALNTNFDKGSFASQELSLAQAQAFLRLDNFDLPEGTPTGWVLMTYKGRGLGWIKSMGNRFNNYFPKHWRIRMELP